MNEQLPIELVGFGAGGFRDAYGSDLVAIRWPEAQSPGCTWRLEFIWQSGIAWLLQSTPTMTKSGHEMGSIRIERTTEGDLPLGFSRAEIRISDFLLAGAKIASATECRVISDCAIALLDENQRELVVATAPAPGAVVLALPGQPCPRTEFSSLDFVWRQA